MTTIYEPVIGMECHAEILTRSKMFYGCAAPGFGILADEGVTKGNRK